MFNLREYVGRIKRNMNEKMLSVKQEAELIEYEKTPYKYALEVLPCMVSGIDYEKCSNCVKYLACDSVANSVISGKLKIGIFAIIKSTISKN